MFGPTLVPCHLSCGGLREGLLVPASGSGSYLVQASTQIKCYFDHFREFFFEVIVLASLSPELAVLNSWDTCTKT